MPSFASLWISTRLASTSSTTGAAPEVTDDLRQTSARTPAIARLTSSRVAGVISWNLRHSVESEATKPNRRASARKNSMSAHASPPPASIAIACTSTLPRSCSGARSEGRGIADESSSPSPSRSANAHRPWSPTCATTPLPPGPTTTGTALVVSISEMPSGVGGLWREEPPVSLTWKAFSRIPAGQITWTRE